MAGSTQVLGISELTQAFKKLGQQIQPAGARRIVMAGARVLKSKAKSAVNEAGLKKSGAMISNIAVKREKSAPQGTEQYHLGVRHGRELGNGKRVIKYLALNRKGRVVTRRQNDPFYWRFLNLGTKHIQAFHFIEAGLEDGGKEAIAAMEKQAMKELQKAGK